MWAGLKLSGENPRCHGKNVQTWETTPWGQDRTHNSGTARLAALPAVPLSRTHVAEPHNLISTDFTINQLNPVCPPSNQLILYIPWSTKPTQHFLLLLNPSQHTPYQPTHPHIPRSTNPSQHTTLLLISPHSFPTNPSQRTPLLLNPCQLTLYYQPTHPQHTPLNSDIFPLH